jgi:hypothetical protein
VTVQYGNVLRQLCLIYSHRRRLGVASGATAPGLRPSLSVCQAIMSGKLEMPIHAAFKILLHGQIPYCSTGMSFVPRLANVLF